MNTFDANVLSEENRLPLHENFIAGVDDRILVTGAAGFIGSRVLQCLLDRGFRNIVCFVRPSSELKELQAIIEHRPSGAEVEIIAGNLLSREDCEAASKDAVIILHVAAGIGEKSYPDAFLNSVVATRNLLDASLSCARLRRFVLVSSFAVYSNCQKPQGRVLDESCPILDRPELRGDAYCFAKVKQEQIVIEYGEKYRIPYTLVRPGSVYGAKKGEITGRVGVGTFGIYLHLGGSNDIPFTFVDNCAEAIILAGLVPGIDGERFNVVDDDLPSSRQFLRRYKKSARSFNSIYIPHWLSYTFCYLWEKYSHWSEGQLPPVFTRMRWHAEWKKTRYSNEKLRTRLGWKQIVTTEEGMHRHFEACKGEARNA